MMRGSRRSSTSGSMSNWTTQHDAPRVIKSSDTNGKLSQDVVLISGRLITSVVSKVPTRKQLVINQANVVIADALKGNDAQAQKLIRRIESDSALTALLK